MALVNAFSSLSISAPATAGLGFKKSVAAFAMPPARVGAARSAVFTVEAKQNKKAHTILVRDGALPDPRARRATRASRDSPSRCAS